MQVQVKQIGIQRINFNSLKYLSLNQYTRDFRVGPQVLASPTGWGQDGSNPLVTDTRCVCSMTARTYHRLTISTEPRFHKPLFD